VSNSDLPDRTMPYRDIPESLRSSFEDAAHLCREIRHHFSGASPQIVDHNSVSQLLTYMTTHGEVKASEPATVQVSIKTSECTTQGVLELIKQTLPLLAEIFLVSEVAAIMREQLRESTLSEHDRARTASQIDVYSRYCSNLIAETIEMVNLIATFRKPQTDFGSSQWLVIARDSDFDDASCRWFNTLAVQRGAAEWAPVSLLRRCSGFLVVGEDVSPGSGR